MLLLLLIDYTYSIKNIFIFLSSMSIHKKIIIPNGANQSDCSQLLEEVREKVQQLKSYGLKAKDISLVIQEVQDLPKLIITAENKIFLGNHDVEIRMEPLLKAVYLLFLSHPEGIRFKDLPDHRNELTRLYDKLKPWGVNDRALQSIEDVTNPLLNSINEKCAKIRKAFLKELDETVASHYYIRGKRGEIKKIYLPRELLVWK